METARTHDGRIITETYTERELYAMYDDMLDECYPEVRIGSMSYSASYALVQLDKIAYRCGFVDWLASEGYEEHPTEDDTYYLDSECEEPVARVLQRLGSIRDGNNET